MNLNEFKSKYQGATFHEDGDCVMAFVDGDLVATWYADGSCCEWLHSFGSAGGDYGPQPSSITSPSDL